ncbi:Mitochondrial inner membrane protease atp23 [Blastocladiella emersonii ATCC 22665]|nr:Mitochondrial inner membrane protease atp23 [Blastocladiella emersonii ATCC 22665]
MLPPNPILPQASPPKTREEQMAARLAAAQQAQCERWKREVLADDPKARRLAEALRAYGCPFDADRHIRCLPCLPVASGGFGADFGILLCANQVISKDHLRETLVHELVHAYDHCVFRYNWMDCKHFACTEVRAANLSGDCGFVREVTRGNFALRGQQLDRRAQECIRRRATLATRHNPHCHGQAEAAVAQVFDACVADRRPFEGTDPLAE